MGIQIQIIFRTVTLPLRTCEAAILGLEGVDDITDKYNIEFVKVNNKKYARSLGIRYHSPLSTSQ